MEKSTEYKALTAAGLVDPGVLAIGLERGWVSAEDVSAYAVDRLTAGTDEPDVVQLTTAETLDREITIDLLRQWATREALPSVSSDEAIRRWMFGLLKAISESCANADEKLDCLEEAYATLGYPEEMRECSRYYVPEHDRTRGIKVGEVTASPLGAMKVLLLRLGQELRIR